MGFMFLLEVNLFMKNISTEKYPKFFFFSKRHRNLLLVANFFAFSPLLAKLFVVDDVDDSSEV